MKHLILISTIFIGLNSCAQKPNQITYILEQLNLDIKNVKTDLIVSKIRPNNPEETIIVIPEIAERGEDYFTLNNYILITNTKTGKIKHNYFENAKANAWVSDAIRLESIKIDTALYKIAKNKNAFGAENSNAEWEYAGIAFSTSDGNNLS